MKKSLLLLLPLILLFGIGFGECSTSDIQQQIDAMNIQPSQPAVVSTISPDVLRYNTLMKQAITQAQQLFDDSGISTDVTWSGTMATGNPIFSYTQTYEDLNPGPTELKSAVTWMYENGLTSYDTVELFRPSDHITREQAAKFYSKFALLQGKIEDSSLPCNFSDIGQATPDLVDDIISSCRLGIFKGYQGHFNPTDYISATDVKVVLIRIAEGILTELPNDYYSSYIQKGVDMGLFADSPKNRQYAPGAEDRGQIAIFMYEYQFPEFRNNQGNRTDM